MKITLPFLFITTTIFSQTWSVLGNSGTDHGTNFLGTIDTQPLIFKTNNVEKLKIHENGKLTINTYSTTDGVSILGKGQNIQDGADMVWIKMYNSQQNDVGVLTLRTANWEYPIFSARENGKILMGIHYANKSFVNCLDCSSYRLFVKDGIRSEKVKVDVASTNAWADYVFKKDYKLSTLEEVEKHISEKGHLPNIPSAEEVMKDGINLGEMDAKLLEKIEELTLYSIEQNKQIKELQKEKKETEYLFELLTEKIKELEKTIK